MKIQSNAGNLILEDILIQLYDILNKGSLNDFNLLVETLIKNKIFQQYLEILLDFFHEKNLDILDRAMYILYLIVDRSEEQKLQIYQLQSIQEMLYVYKKQNHHFSYQYYLELQGFLLNKQTMLQQIDTQQIQNEVQNLLQFEFKEGLLSAYMNFFMLYYQLKKNFNPIKVCQKV